MEVRETYTKTDVVLAPPRSKSCPISHGSVKFSANPLAHRRRMADAMRYFVLLLLLLSSLPAQEVEHAPTVEQCRADQRLWLAKIEGPSGTLPGYLTLVSWSHEMGECTSVDPDNHALYFNVVGEIGSEELIRLEHFLDRHALLEKFIEEDKAGKR
jgi:hypothetical protein